MTERQEPIRAPESLAGVSPATYRPLFWLFGVTAAAVILFALVREYQAEELDTIHTAWKILRGERPYLDFFLNHQPLLYFLLLPLVFLFGEGVTTLFVSRALLIMVGGGIAMMGYRMAGRLFNNRVHAFASLFLILLIIPYAQAGLQLRPEVPMVLLEVVALNHLVEFAVSRRRHKLILGACAFSGALWFSEKAWPFAVLVMVLLLIASLRKRFRAADLGIFAGVAAAVLAPLVLLLLLTGALGRYLQWVWSLNLGLVFSATPALEVLGRNLLLSAVPLLFFVAGLFTGRKIPWLWHLALLAAGPLAMAVLAPNATAADLLPILPPVAVIGAHAFNAMFEKTRRLARAVVLLLVPLVLFNAGFLVWQMNRLYPQLQRVGTVVAATTPGDVVLDLSRERCNLYRPDAGFFWSDPETVGGVRESFLERIGWRFDPASLIEQVKPKVICVGSSLDPKDPVLAPSYQASPIEGILIRSGD